MKRWFHSKTHWLNISVGLSMITVVLTYINDIGLDPQMSAMIGLALTAIQTIGNVYLRNISSSAIVGKEDYADAQFSDVEDL